MVHCGQPVRKLTRSTQMLQPLGGQSVRQVNQRALQQPSAAKTQRRNTTSTLSTDTATAATAAAATAVPALTAVAAAPTHDLAMGQGRVDPQAALHHDPAQIEARRPTPATAGSIANTERMQTFANRPAPIRGVPRCSNSNSSRETDAGGAGDFLGHPPIK